MKIEDVPELRRGPNAGYTGKAEMNAADRRLRLALAACAREIDPAARLAGAQIAEAAAAVLGELAARAEAASPKLRRRLRQLANVEAKLAEAAALAAARAAQSPTPAATRATGTQQRRA